MNRENIIHIMMLTEESSVKEFLNAYEKIHSKITKHAVLYFHILAMINLTF